MKAFLALLLSAGLALPASASAGRRHKAVRKARKTAAAKPAAPAYAPSRAETLMKLGMGNLNRQEYTPAIDRFNQAVAADASASAYFLLGYAYYQRGFLAGTPEAADPEDARQVIDAYNMAAAIDPKLSTLREPHRLHQGLAMAYEAVGENEKAMEAYKRAFAAAPDNAMMPLYAARLRLKMGEADKASTNLSIALAKARATGQEESLRVLVARSPLFAQVRQDGRMQAVLSAGTLTAARPAAPSSGGFGLRDSVKGTAPADNRPRIREKDQAVLDQLADANEKFKFREWRGAITAYGDTVSLNSDAGVLGPQQISLVHEKIGTCYNKLGQSGEAIRELELAVRIMPFNASAHYQLALAHSVSGRYGESLRALREAFKTAPSPGELRRSMLLAKTDTELEPVRDLPAFHSLIDGYQERVARR